MAEIGFMPTRTSVLVRDPDGDAGTIPAATRGSAGVMTAHQARALQEVAGKLGVPLEMPAAIEAPDVPSIARAMPTPAPAEVSKADLADVRAHVEGLSMRIGQAMARVDTIEQRAVTPMPLPPPSVMERPSPGPSQEVLSRLEQVEQRIAAAEQRLVDPGPANDDDGEDLPAFLGKRPAAPSAAEPRRPSPAQSVALDAVLARLDAAEQAISRLGADVRQLNDTELRLQLSVALERVAKLEAAATAPSYRLVEVAHLARNGQQQPLELMIQIGEAMGCDWEAAANHIIQEHEAAAVVEAAAYAQANRGKAQANGG